jgi:hypothetical protein
LALDEERDDNILSYYAERHSGVACRLAEARIPERNVSCGMRFLPRMARIVVCIDGLNCEHDEDGKSGC